MFIIVQRDPKDRFLDFLNSKANELASGISGLAKNVSNFAGGSSLSAPSGSLANNNDNSALIFGGICVVALVVVGGLCIYAMSKKC